MQLADALMSAAFLCFFFLPLSSSLEVWILFDSILSFLPAFLTKETSTNKRRDFFFFFFPSRCSV